MYVQLSTVADSMAKLESRAYFEAGKLSVTHQHLPPAASYHHMVGNSRGKANTLAPNLCQNISLPGLP